MKQSAALQHIQINTHPAPQAQHLFLLFLISCVKVVLARKFRLQSIFQHIFEDNEVSFQVAIQAILSACIVCKTCDLLCSLIWKGSRGTEKKKSPCSTCCQLQLNIVTGVKLTSRHMRDRMNDTSCDDLLLCWKFPFQLQFHILLVLLCYYTVKVKLFLPRSHNCWCRYWLL